MAQTLTNYDAVLKEDYEGDIRETLNNEIRLFSLLEETDAETQGRRLVMPIHLSRNSGVGARGENVDLPSAGNQGYQDAFAKAKYNYTRIQITVQTIKASRNNMGAFTRALKSELKGAVTDLKVEMNYQSFNDGSGARALVNSTVATNSTNIRVDSPHGLDFHTAISNMDHTRTLKVGQVIIFGSARFNPTVRGLGTLTIGTITAAATNYSTIEFAGGGTVGNNGMADNDFIFSTGATVAATAGSTDLYSSKIEMTGLLGIIDTTTFNTNFQGISRSTYPTQWRATVQGSYSTTSSTNLSLDNMQRVEDGMSEAGNGMLDCLFAHYSARREYLKLVQTDKRYVNTQNMDPGYTEDWRINRGKSTTLEFNGVPFFFEKDCPYGTIFFVDRSSCQIFTQADFEWADEDGAILSRVANRDTFEAFMRVYKNIVCDAPNKNGVMRGVNFTP